MLEPDLEAHLDDGCPDCARRESILGAMLRAAAAPAAPRVPDAWRKRALSIPTAASKPGRSATSRVRDLVARFVQDVSGAPSPALALRGPGVTERHALYKAGPFEIDLALFDSGALVGQVVAEDGDDAPLRSGYCVLLGEDATRDTLLEPGGDFHFADVAPGEYDLLLETPDLRVRVHDVALGGGSEEDR